jgi:hypothetical protein
MRTIYDKADGSVVEVVVLESREPPLAGSYIDLWYVGVITESALTKGLSPSCQEHGIQLQTLTKPNVPFKPA